MSFTQRDVTRFYDSLVFPSRVRDSEYSLLASDVIKNGWRVGDFGCGQSLFYSAFQKLDLKPVFLDTSSNALKTIDYGVKLRADISQIPLKDEIFNAVFCIGVLHHLPDMHAALAELRRSSLRKRMRSAFAFNRTAAERLQPAAATLNIAFRLLRTGRSGSFTRE